MRKYILATAILAAFVGTSVTPALARRAKLNAPDGQTVRLAWKDSGCFMSGVDKSGKRSNTRVGLGGSANFEYHMKRLKAEGYSS